MAAAPAASPSPAPLAVSSPAAADLQAPSPTQQPAEQVSPQGSVPLRVRVGKSILINSADRLRRVSVTDPAVADAIVVTPNQVLVHGKTPGEVSLMLWNEAERSQTFDLRVDVDITTASEEMKRVFPEEPIEVSASRDAIVLSGRVSSKEAADRAGLIAGAFSPKVVNVLSFGPQGAQSVMLEVKFAEVDRTALLQAGVNLFSTGAGNLIGQTSTEQFDVLGRFELNDVTRTPAGPFATELEFSEMLNVFLFHPDIHLGAVLKLLKQKNVLQILAEPNLIAVNGKEASFLAGGEFPFPVVQPSAGGFTSVTILFKEFGVRLSFTPLIMPNGNLRLTVKPEVSALDFTNALTVSGFLIPALSTRRASTEFELRDGQSFIIAGLMDNRLTDVASKVPGLGDIPILGQLFRSKNQQKSKTELMVLVTARRVSPLDKPPPLPKFPREFIDNPKFDNGKPAGGAKP
jgi:pilus assembly protein CpaC